MATTPGGLPFPLGTDRVMDGDDAIHALAAALDLYWNQATADTVVNTTTPVLVPGCSRALTIPGPGWDVFVTANTDINIGSGSGITYLQVMLDGVVAAQATFNLVAGRWPVARTFRLAGVTAGAHTVALRGNYGAGSGVTLFQAATNMIVQPRPPAGS